MEFKKIQHATFIGLLVGITVLFLWMVRPYFYPVFWAAVIAALFYPLYQRLVKACRGRRSVAAGITEAIIALLVVLPLAGIISLVVQQAISVYREFNQNDLVDTLSRYFMELKQWPIASRLLDLVDVNDITSRLSSAGATATKWVYQFVAKGGQHTAQWIVQLFIMLYTLFYFLRDGESFLKQLMHLLPLGDRYERMLYERFVSTTRATLKGTLLIGVIQGTIGGIAFVVAGIPAAVFWGMVMVVLSIIPGVGAAVVMIPTIIILFFIEHYWQAGVILVALVIASFTDNILRGPLIGKDAQMHPLLIFFATIGGIVAFGVSGIVIGPVLTAFLLSIWQIYEEKYRGALEQSG